METSETFDYENLVELLCVKKGYFRDTFLSEKRRERLTEDKNYWNGIKEMGNINK